MGFGYCLFYNGSADKTLVDKSGNVIKVDENGFAPIDSDFVLCEAKDGRKGVAYRNGNMLIPLALPVFYYTQLLALAFGLPEKTMRFDKLAVNPKPLLDKIAERRDARVMAAYNEARKAAGV